MFSGIVEEMGVVKSFEPGLAGARLSILARTILKDLQLGESVSVSGACLTVSLTLVKRIFQLTSRSKP